MAYQAGLIEAIIEKATGDVCRAGDLTWNGHEFLDAIKNDTVWNDVKKTAAKHGGSLPFDIVKALAVKLVGNIVGI